MPRITDAMLASVASGVGLHLHNIRHVFTGNVEAIRRVDLQVAPAEFLAILGPSGCGKSTLLRLIAGLDQPSEGTVEIVAPPPSPHHGDDTTPKNELEHGVQFDPRTDMAFVFQDAHLLPWRTVMHNAALPLELQGVPEQQRLEIARQSLDLVGLHDFADRYPAQLSGGMRMRVSIARALSTKPRLLLMDEPFAALDEITRQRLDELLRKLWAEQRMTIVFVTHSTQEATFLADRAIVMSRRPGRVVLDHPIDLPAQRTGELRADVVFVRHMRVLYEALERGEGATL